MSQGQIVEITNRQSRYWGGGFICLPGDTLVSSRRGAGTQVPNNKTMIITHSSDKMFNNFLQPFCIFRYIQLKLTRMPAARDEQMFNVNLEEILEKYTWKRYKSDKGFIKNLFTRKSNYYVDIRWGYLEFSHKTTRFDIRPDAADMVPTEIATSSRPSGGKSGDKKSPSRSPGGSKEVILYKSDYVNDTPLEQKYTFSTTRTTTASTSIELEETFTKGGEASIEISVPGDIVTVGAGLSGELSVTETEGQTFEESLTWEVNTEINVDKGHKAEAVVVVSEKNSLADFEVKTTVSLPDGKDLPIAIRRRSDDAIEYVIIVNDLKAVFGSYAEGRNNIDLVQNPDEKRKMMRYDVIFTTHGTCKSISWKNQHVEVHSEALPGANGEKEQIGSDSGKDGE